MPHVVRDGVKLFYDEAGSGDPALVFVHGWCCDRSYHAPQFEHFGATHRVITVDLRGHGDSDKPDDGYTIPNFADDVAAVCGALSLNKPVIVGHSMGGAIALSLSVRHPELARAIVMLDGALPAPASLSAVGKPLGAAFRSEGYLAPLTGVVNGLFIATDDATRRAHITQSMVATPQRVMAAEWEAIWANDWVAEARACRAPAMYVGAHVFMADMVRLRELMPHVVSAQTVGAGHFHQLEVPDQVNAMIERFLRTSCA